MKVTSIGQATYLIEDGSLSVLTDPWFSSSGLNAIFAPRLVPPALQADQIKSCDLVLLSHIHIDHWDRSAAMLSARCQSTIVTSVEVARRLKKSGLNAVGLADGESWNGLGVTVEAINAEHPFSPGAIGLVYSGRKKIYFSGDTLNHQGLDKLAGYNLDLALLQSSCANYPFIGPDGMDWPAAVSLVRRVKPSVFMPMHFTCKGKYLDLSQKIKITEREAVKEYLSRQEKELLAEGIDCRILWPGETGEI